MAEDKHMKKQKRRRLEAEVKRQRIESVDEFSGTGHTNGHALSSRASKEYKSKFPRDVFEGTDEIQSVTNSILPDSAFSEGDEVWIVECPKNLNLSELIDSSNINFADVTKLTDDKISHVSDNRCEWIGIGSKKLSDGNPKESVVTLQSDDEGRMKLAVAPVRGYIKVREQIDDQPIIYLPEEKKVTRTTPISVKQRNSIGVAEVNDSSIMNCADTPRRKRKRKAK